MNQTPARVDIDAVVSDLMHLITDCIKTHPTETKIITIATIVIVILAFLKPKEAIKSLPRFK